MEHNMRLTPEEEAILNGEQGESLAKVMKTLVLYGDAFGAEKFVDVTGPSHLVTSFGLNVLKPVFAIMDELIAGGVKAKMPFTVDPRPDFANIESGLLENLVFKKIMYGMQEAYDAQLAKLGLKNS
ncbi:MAG TPA: aconitase X, partial [Clostridiales bacterium]|nr:aconitase X [Clostridiales bacterium]